MGSRRAGIQLTDAEVQALLRDNLKVQVASLGNDGWPHLTTLFYVLDPAGRIAFWTYAASQKIRNLERDPWVSALVEDGIRYDELRGVSIRGRAEVIRDPEAIYTIGSAVAVAMAGVPSLSDLGEMGISMVRRQATKRVAVVIHPENVASWDHRKLARGGVG